MDQADATPNFRRRVGGIDWLLPRGHLGLVRELREVLLRALEEPDVADPALARLFPSAVTGDAEADAELRGMLFDTLLERRTRGLEALGQLLDRGEEKRGVLRVRLTPPDAELVLSVLNDIRLLLGARIGIDDVDREALAADDERWPVLAMMDELGWLQEQLIQLIAGPFDPPPH